MFLMRLERTLPDSAGCFLLGILGESSRKSQTIGLFLYEEDHPRNRKWLIDIALVHPFLDTG